MTKSDGAEPGSLTWGQQYSNKKGESSDQIQIPAVGAVTGKLKGLLFSLDGPVFSNL